MVKKKWVSWQKPLSKFVMAERQESGDVVISSSGRGATGITLSAAEARKLYQFLSADYRD